MKKREVRAQRERILKALERWQPILLPGDWKLNHHFVSDETHPEDDCCSWTVATTTPSWEYQIAFMSWFLQPASEIHDDEMEEIVIHELLHCVVSQMTNGEPSKAQERCVTALSRAFMRAVA